jgi:hypothetical protein
VNRWATRWWQLLRDILVTGTGLAVITSQLFSHRPSDVLLVTGLALTVPSAASHTVGILRGPTEPSSSPSSESASSPRSSSSPPAGG